MEDDKQRPRITKQKRMVHALIMSVILVALQWSLFSVYAPRVESGRLASFIGIAGVINDTSRIVTPSGVTIIELSPSTTPRDDARQKLVRQREQEAELLERVAEEGAKAVVLNLYLSKESQPDIDQRLSAAIAKVPTILAVTSKYLPTSTNKSYNWQAVTSLPIFSTSARSVAHLRFGALNGPIAEFHGERELNSKVYPSLSQAISAIARLTQPDPHYRSYVKYYGAPGTIVPLKSSEVLAKPAGSTFKDKIVVIGVARANDSSDGLFSSFRFSDSGIEMSILELCATAIANLIDGRAIRRLPFETESLLILAILGVTTFAMWFLEGKWAIAAFGLICSAWLGVSLILFRFDFFFPLAIFTGLFPWVIILRVLKAVKGEIKSALTMIGSCLPRRSPKRPGKSTGVGSIIQVRWANIKDSPDALTQVQNAAAEIVSARGGVVYSSSIDTLLASWGIPDKCELCAEKAIETATEIALMLKNKQDATMSFSIGVASGQLNSLLFGPPAAPRLVATGETAERVARLQALAAEQTSIIVFDDETSKRIPKTKYPATPTNPPQSGEKAFRVILGEV